MPTLANPDAALGLKALANNLAPILRGGFECRLSTDSSPVDFQQCIAADESESTLLQEKVYASVTSAIGRSADPRVSQLQDFLAQWQLSLHAIPEIWLEYDVNHSSAFALPAIFFGLPQEVSPALETYSIATKSLDLLLGHSGWHEWQHNVEQCFRACPDGVFISHIGVMLSRKTPALRVNVKRLQPDTLTPYLQEIGWPGETEELEALMEQLLRFVDRITVCLDVGDRIYPKIGLECILLKDPNNRDRWASFLDNLVEQQLCTEDKKTALLKWIDPNQKINSIPTWPLRFSPKPIAETPDQSHLLDRQLSHIKLTWQPQQPLEAKAYLWFEHQAFSTARARSSLPRYSQVDIDEFYSRESIPAWKAIIGDNLHYHFGYFKGSEDLKTGLRQTVRNYYPYIKPGSRVLDIGCGWGGPATMLIDDLQCSVTGISCSTAQVNYCQNLGLTVLRQDLDREMDKTSGKYDTIFSLEMISHIRDKARLLHQLRSLGSRLILSANCVEDNVSGDRLTFGDSMVLCTVSELIEDIEQAGWTIQVMQNRRFQSLRTIALWRENFDRIYGDLQPPGQLGSLRSLVEIALRSPAQWCQAFPLIDIVAD